MREILGTAKTVRALLGGTKYAVDYYQREYRWQTKHITELLHDLAAKFGEDYEKGHERSAVQNYGHYFLGSIIISDKDGKKYIIDGQQRLTSLTLLLIFLHRRIEDSEQKGQLAELIFSQKYGKRSFNLDVSDRVVCMEALYQGQSFDDDGHSESVANILGRYRDIEEQFPEDLTGQALPYFADWLVENVHLVEITAFSDEDAYTIFETMNDRGLSLTPTDMLKGYLLANIGDTSIRSRASAVWLTRVRVLQGLGKEEDADAIKSWLRSHHAESIRERKRGADPMDFDRIGTEFHRWVRAHEASLGLKGDTEFARFIETDFAFYSRQYARLREASKKLTLGIEAVFYNAQHDFTLQYAVLLAPLQVSDPDAEVERKIRVTATFIDILLARRIWNFRAIDYSTMQYAMFLVIKEIRDKSVAELVDALRKRLDAEAETFASNDRFRMHAANRRQVHRMIARMTTFLETESGLASRYVEYLQRQGSQGYEVEHVWADHPEQHTDEFPHPSDFQEQRNRIGGLLLLPKPFNASYGDLPYEKKLPHYDSQNLLVRSLHPRCYEHNPGFLRLRDSGLHFKHYPQFKKMDLEERCALYRQIAERIWNSERLAAVAGL